MLATLIASVLSGEASDAFARSRRAFVAYALAALLALVGVGFLVGAFYIVLARRVGSLEASLWLGGGAIALSLVIVVFHKIIASVRARRTARRRRTEITAVASAAAIATLPALLGKGRGMVLLAPALAAIGYAIWRERNPRRRDDRLD
jgi:hypothetical protein